MPSIVNVAERVDDPIERVRVAPADAAEEGGEQLAFEDDDVQQDLTLSIADVAASISAAPAQPAVAAEADAVVESDANEDRPPKTLIADALVSAYGDHVHLSSISPLAFDDSIPELAGDNVKDLAMSYRAQREIYSSIDLSRPTNLLVQVLGDRARLALAGSEYADVETALRSVHKNSVREMWAKRLWVEQNFSKLQPGCLIGIQPYDDSEKKRGRSTESFGERMRNLFRERAMITALIPPPPGKEGQLSKWKVEAVVPGDEKPRQFSLSKLLEDVSLMALMRNEQVSELQLNGGPTVYGFGFAGQPVVSEYDSFKEIRMKFDTAPRGFCDRKGYVLEGNMYLASEWAQATGKGRGVVYTDESGMRHRAVLLTQSSLYGDRDLFNHLPIRLWLPQMISGFTERIWDQTAEDAIPSNFAGGGYLFKTDFASAMSEGSAAKQGSSQFLVMPGHSVAVALDRKELARASRAMKSEAKRRFDEKHPHFDLYTPDQKAAAKAADLVMIKTSSKRGQPSMVLIETDTLEKAKVAVELISRSVGLELYLWPHSRAGQAASEIVGQYFEGRREEALALREVARERREARVAQIAQAQAVAEAVPDAQPPVPPVAPTQQEETSAENEAPVLRVSNG